MPKYSKLLHPDEDEVDMRAVVPSAKVGGASYKVRQSKQVGTGRAPRPPGAQSRQVRVKVKTHDKGGNGYRSSIAATLNYVAKEGRTFDRTDDLTERDKDALSGEWKDDRLIHHWMINPEDGDLLTLDQVKAMTRDTMERVSAQLPKDERDDFRWMAGAEQKDGRWHVHVAVRGVANDRDLKFHPVYERHWIRHHAEEAATDQLGWRGARAIEDERLRDRERDARQGRDLTDDRERTRGRDRADERTHDRTEDRSDDPHDERRRRVLERDIMEGR